jgi:hypothetical protein
MSATDHAVFCEYLASPRAAAAKPWQIAVLRDLRFPGTPSVETYARLQSALDTACPARRLGAGSVK